jgi:hypothetical protein
MALSVLLLCDDHRSHAPNVLEHIGALRRFSRHHVDVFNPRGLKRSRILRLDGYDAAVVHYTIFALSDNYLAPWFREQLAAFGGLKVQFIQDEYRQVDAVAERMRELGIELLFSSVPADAVPQVYGPRLPGVDVVSTLTGYVPAELERRSRPPLDGRPLDVVYRGRAIPYWLGRLGQDKIVIGREFLARAASTKLRCDIAWTEAERIYGDDWYRFLGSARTTLGTESGASIVDFDGSLQERTESYLRAHPGASFEEVERELLSPFEGNAVIEAISPRVFEAAALGTAVVNCAGRYSDVIEPWVHYVPLEKDFSNFGEVLAAVEDDDVLEPIAARAHTDLVASEEFSLRRFVEGFDRAVETRVRPATRRPRSRAGRAATRPLLGLEQLAAPGRRGELPLVASLGTRALERTERRLLGRFPEIQALATGQVGTSRYEKTLQDLVRLAAATAAHLRELRYLGPPFDVQPALDDDDRRLTLVGTRCPAQDASQREQLRTRLATAIHEGRLEEIVWNNSEIGGLTFVSVPLSSLEVGYHITTATHRFTMLTELARDEPNAVLAALEPLFRARPESPVNELDPRTATLLRLLLRPGPTAARGVATARGVLASKELRRLLQAYLGNRDARAEASVDHVLKDLFRLSLVAEAQASAELDAERKTLIYRTNGGRASGHAVLDPATVRSLEQILWEHSEADSSISWEQGVYELDALTLVARRFPELAAPALARAAAAR